MNDFTFDRATTVRDQFKLAGLTDILNLEGLTEIAVNNPHQVWFDRGQGWETRHLPGLTLDLCLDIAKSLAVFSGLTRPIGEDNPIASVILPNGERGQICVPPATERGVVSMTFRKPSTARFTLDDYEKTQRFANYTARESGEMQLSASQSQLLALKKQGKIAEFFKLSVQTQKNILLVGGTGSGKTTIMKAMVDHYLYTKRLLTIEDIHELDLPLHPNHLHLFYKKGGLTPRQIIEACMRMKPDHVLLAELRGDEAWAYLEMLNTGHQGSITTIHANDCRSACSRMADLIKQSEFGRTLEYTHIMRTIHTSIDVIAFFKDTYLTELYFDPLFKNKQ